MSHSAGGDSNFSFVRQVNSQDDLSNLRPDYVPGRPNPETETPTSESGAQIPSVVRSYLNHARFTQGLLPFQLIAYPDLVNAPGAPHLEPFMVYTNSRPSARTIGSTTLNPNTSTVEAELSNENTERVNTPGDTVAHTNTTRPTNVTYTSYLTVPTTESRRVSSLKTEKSDRRSNGANRTAGTANGIRHRSANHKNSGSGLTLEKAPRLPYSLIGLRHAEILDDVRRLIDPDDVIYRTVFDLDETTLATVRELQQNHQSRLPDSRSNSPRSILGRAGLPHTLNDYDENATPVLLSAMPSQSQQQQSQQQQQQQFHRSQVSTTSAVHISPSTGLANRMTASPESQRVTGIVSCPSTATLQPHVTDGCECGGHGDCALTNEDEAW
ncbi:unnamed protein product [Echinostoma caproni]|uniref:Uncharacterized protein n=1 Tax=Echinostoma caproni TaxID=27848 RepID=A0A3P8LCA8_9TREM|nr:unnamed protein product [Echinostoma caproni]